MPSCASTGRRRARCWRTRPTGCCTWDAFEDAVARAAHRLAGGAAPPARPGAAFEAGDDLQASSLGQAIAEDYLLGDGRPCRPSTGTRASCGCAGSIAAAPPCCGARCARRCPTGGSPRPAGGFASGPRRPPAAPAVEELASCARPSPPGVTFDPGSTFRPDAAPSPAGGPPLLFGRPGDRVRGRRPASGAGPGVGALGAPGIAARAR